MTRLQRQRADRSIALAAWLVLGVGVLALAGCRGGPQTAGADKPAVNVGLAALMGEDPATVEAEPATPESPGADPNDLERFVQEQTTALEQALAAEAQTGQPGRDAPQAEAEVAPQAEPAVDVSLAALEAEDAAEGGPAQEPGMDQISENTGTQADEVQVEDLFAHLDRALGQELEATSKPFRTAVAMIALAAAQGRDPAAAVAAGTPAGDKLSPSERESARAVAELLGTLLSSEGSESDGRTAALERLAERLTADLGFRIPSAVLCTRVRGFGKYEPFAITDFLAGRPVRALVYAEVEGFEHRPVDTSNLGGLVPEDQWSVELSEELMLFHVSDARLAWRRPAEKIVETSRNKQRDFYLLAEIELPRTLTVGSYELKVIITDGVSGAVAERTIPIGIVADPALAWHPQ